MKKDIKIPVALQLATDDLFWFNGWDERFKNRPSRTGIPRKHCPEDYYAMNAIGKAVDMKINCAMVIGEWDKNNVLRGVPHVTWDEQGWDMASEIDMPLAEACFEAAESCEYLSYAFHGLMHGFYHDGKLITEREHFPFAYDEKNGTYSREYTKLPIEDFERRIALFYEIYNAWGFQKKIETYVSPCAIPNDLGPEESKDYIAVLKKYGMNYWVNGWGRDKSLVVADGLIFSRKACNISWEVYDTDPAYLPDLFSEEQEHPSYMYGTHWPNFLRFNPENNMEKVDAWAKYLNKQCEIFGVMMSKDVPFASSQGVYNMFAKLDVTDSKCFIDLTEVDSQNAIGLKNEFYISFRNGITSKGCIGGEISEYNTRKAFKTYKITRNGESRVEVLL